MIDDEYAYCGAPKETECIHKEENRCMLLVIECNHKREEIEVLEKSQETKDLDENKIDGNGNRFDL